MYLFTWLFGEYYLLVYLIQEVSDFVDWIPFENNIDFGKVCQECQFLFPLIKLIPAKEKAVKVVFSIHVSDFEQKMLKLLPNQILHHGGQNRSGNQSLCRPI